MRNSFIRNKTGQFRLIEALLAALVLFTIFTAAIYLTSTSRIHVLQERSDLDRVGHNILLRLVESGVIESTVETTPSGFEPILKNAITKSLPPLTYYDLKIYNRTDTSAVPSFTQVGEDVTNAAAGDFEKASEVSSSSFIYTSSSSGNNYYLVLALAKAG